MDDATEKSKPLEPPEGAVRAGRGYVVAKSTVSKPAHGIGTAPPGICPRCDTEAPGWIPPMDDHLYKRRIAQLKEAFKLESDTAAHKLHVERAGGFIATCSKCALTFWVPSSATKIKE